MNILARIIDDKKREVALKKTLIPIAQLENAALFNSRTLSLSKSLQNHPCGIIAEHKRRSPSKGEINYKLSVAQIVQGYEMAGAAGISVLTDGLYFGGSSDDFLLGRASVNLPMLRKEFIFDSYQIFESKAMGADAVLLIAAVLSPQDIKSLSKLAQSLAMEVLLEVHNLDELQRSMVPSLNMIGVNNRNLDTFEVDVQNSALLCDAIPNEFIKVSESGINEMQSVIRLQQLGYQGFLIGENFMKATDPGAALQHFLQSHEWHGKSN